MLAYTGLMEIHLGCFFTMPLVFSVFFRGIGLFIEIFKLCLVNQFKLVNFGITHLKKLG